MKYGFQLFSLANRKRKIQKKTHKRLTSLRNNTSLNKNQIKLTDYSCQLDDVMQEIENIRQDLTIVCGVVYQFDKTGTSPLQAKELYKKGSNLLIVYEGKLSDIKQNILSSSLPKDTINIMLAKITTCENTINGMHSSFNEFDSFFDNLNEDTCSSESENFSEDEFDCHDSPIYSHSGY